MIFFLTLIFSTLIVSPDLLTLMFVLLVVALGSLLNFKKDVYPKLSIYGISVASFISLSHYLHGLDSRFLGFYLNDINIHFIILTNFVGALVIILSTRAVLTSHRLFYSLLNLIFLCLNCFFTSDNLLSFYIFFEASAVPMFILIGLFGAGSTRHKAAYKFIIYSLIGSTTLLPGLIYIYRTFKTLSLYELTHFVEISTNEQVFLALAFFLPFAIKMPVMPFHLWLPEAHVEAPTAISVLLAGLLLKTGSFAFYVVVIYTFKEGAIIIAPLAIVLGLFSLVVSSFYAVVQTDIKKLIAYSSVSHMSLVLIGLFSFTEIGLKGAYLFMISHGINSAALFSVVGVLYDRGHIRLIRAYNGLVLTMPLFITFFFLLTLGNAGFPFTPGFFAEFFSFAGFIKSNPIAGLFGGLAVVLSLVYSVWCFSRISFGNINFLRYTQDLEPVELAVLTCYIYSFTLLGFNSSIVLNLLVQPQLTMTSQYVQIDSNIWLFAFLFVIVLTRYFFAGKVKLVYLTSGLPSLNCLRRLIMDKQDKTNFNLLVFICSGFTFTNMTVFVKLYKKFNCLVGSLYYYLAFQPSLLVLFLNISVTTCLYFLNCNAVLASDNVDFLSEEQARRLWDSHYSDMFWKQQEHRTVMSQFRPPPTHSIDYTDWLDYHYFREGFKFRPDYSLQNDITVKSVKESAETVADRVSAKKIVPRTAIEWIVCGTVVYLLLKYGVGSQR